MFEVIATIVTLGVTSRINAAADTPSSVGMMISMKIRSYLSGSLLTLFTASWPSRCLIVSQCSRILSRIAFTHSNFNSAVDLRQKLRSDPRTRLVILDQQDSGFLGSPLDDLLFFRWRRGDLCRRFGHGLVRVAERTGIWDTVDMVGVERINTNRLPNRIHKVSRVTEWILHHSRWHSSRVGLRKHDRGGCSRVGGRGLVRHG